MQVVCQPIQKKILVEIYKLRQMKLLFQRKQRLVQPASRVVAKSWLADPGKIQIPVCIRQQALKLQKDL